MATYSKALLSGSTSGLGILVAATATPGTLLHTAVAGAVAWDEIWLYCVNSSASSVKLTVEWGEVTSPNGHIEYVVPAEAGLYLIAPGLLLNGGLVVRAFAGTGNVLIIHGFVNKIT